MPSFTARVQFLRLVLLATIVGGGGWLQLNDQPGMILLVVFAWRIRHWVVPAIRGRLALRGPIERIDYDHDLLAIELPASWVVEKNKQRTEELSHIHEIDVDGPGVYLTVMAIDPADENANPETLIEDRIESLAEDYTIRSRVAGTCTFADRPAARVEVSASSWGDFIVLQFTAAHAGEALLFATTSRDPAVPRRLLERALASVEFRPRQT